LGARLRAIRVEVFGEDGIDIISEKLGVAPRTWQSYEEVGEVMPAQTLLRFIELTGADPLWLMRGEGRKYRKARRKGGQDPDSSAAPSPRRTSRGDVDSGRSNDRSSSADPA
jgi:hypothetical protein